LTLSSLDDDFTADDDAISLVTLWEKQFQSARSDSEPTPKAASMLRKVSQTPEEERKSSQHSSSTRTTDAMMSKKREKKFLKLGACRSPQVAFRFLARSVSDDPSSYTKRKCEGEIEMVSLFVFIHQHAACVFMPFFFGYFSASLPFHQARRRGRKGDRLWLSRFGFSDCFFRV
jgi:hypothetical protein